MTGIEAYTNSSGQERPMEAPAATCLYRVTQESLANVLKHSQATRVGVTLDFLPDVAQLAIHDDGHGFDTINPSGYGIANIRQRVEELGGTFNLQSSSGKGTQIIVRLPC